jgi:cytochrome P450
MIPQTRDALWISRNPVGYGRDRWHARSHTVAPRPPGPRGRPFVGVLSEYQADPVGYVQKMAQVHGDVFQLPLPFFDVVVVNHPDYIGQVMNCLQGEYSTLSPSGDFAKVAVGKSMGTLNGVRFRERRKMLTPMFARDRLAVMGGTLVDEFARRLSKWDRFAEANEPIDLQAEVLLVIKPATIRVMFSLELTETELLRLDADVRSWLSAYVLVPLGQMPRLLPGPGNIGQAWLRVRKFVQSRIDERLASNERRDDILQAVLDMHCRDDNPVSRRDALLEMIVLLSASWESVAAAVAYTLGALPQNQSAQQRVFDEVDALGGDMPRYEDLARLQWTRACFEEGQRLQTLPFILRRATVDDTIGGYRIRRGNLLAISPPAVQRDSRWWGPSADSYDPTRFYDAGIVAARPNLAFIPFGAGPHRCIGATLARMSAQFLLAQIFQRFRLAPPPGWTAQRDKNIPWKVEGGIPFNISKVSARGLDSALR